MAFEFKQNESVSDGIHRMALERIERSLRCLEAKRTEAEAIHQARKNIKKLRALLRLVRHEIGDATYRRETAILREAAGQLAGARDARIQVDTLDVLIAHFETQLAAKPFSHLRQNLQQHVKSEIGQLKKRQGDKDAVRLYNTVRKHLKNWRFDADEWDAIAPGIHRTFSRGRTALRQAEAKPSPEHFHEWRKRAKDLWYHIRLIVPAWPGTLEALSEQLKELTDFLGDHHDLEVLRKTVESRQAPPGTEAETETLIGLIEQRQSDLSSAALALGRFLYAEKPSAFCKRIGKYWTFWRA